MARNAALAKALAGNVEWAYAGNDSTPPPVGPPHAPKYPFSMMGVGESVIIRNRTAAAVSQAVYNYRKRTPDAGTFAVRKQSATSCKVWRTS
jgi:hypothetical protein